jgi:glycosyltransferase involved in cell wall biosynthesis
MHTTIIIICYETQPLIRTAYESIRNFYPDIKVIIVDGSKERSDCHHYTTGIRGTHTEVYQVHRNIGHGEGMHFAMKHVQTKYALLMDSDVVIKHGNIIESMEDCLETFTVKKSDVGAFDFSKRFYGCGQIITVNNGGSNSPDGFPYLHPHFALVDVEAYRAYPPAAHHGAPMILPMRELHSTGRSDLLKEFPVSEYISHKGRGTVRTVKRNEYTRNWVK